jgi:hypothetical protein
MVAADDLVAVVKRSHNQCVRRVKTVGDTRGELIDDILPRLNTRVVRVGVQSGDGECDVFSVHAAFP